MSGSASMIERAEDEAAIRFHARHLRDVVFRIAHVVGIALRPRHAAQLAGVEEIPAVVRALERFGVALVPAAQRRAAMGAAVVQRADFSVAVAHDNERAQAHAPGDEVVVVRDFAFVREIGPGAAEDVGHLGFENGGIGIDQAMGAVLLDEIIPIVQRGAAEPGRRRTDFLQRRHATCSLSHASHARIPRRHERRECAQKKSKYSFCSQSLGSSLGVDAPVSSSER